MITVFKKMHHTEEKVMQETWENEEDVQKISTF